MNLLLIGAGMLILLVVAYWMLTDTPSEVVDASSLAKEAAAEPKVEEKPKEVGLRSPCCQAYVYLLF
jgi:hypothetical protein